VFPLPLVQKGNKTEKTSSFTNQNQYGHTKDEALRTNYVLQNGDKRKGNGQRKTGVISKRYL
jgi:hypothetical protein